MTVERPITSGQPIWRQICDTLADEIAAGIYPAGGRLPGEHAMAARFGVNRHTVRRAIAALTERDLIHVRRGAGAVVTGQAIDYHLDATPRFGENLRREGRTPSRRTLRLETVRADASDARRLGIAAGAPIVVLETVGMADGQPISVSENRFPAERLPGIEVALSETMLAPESASITEALRRCGVGRYARSSTRVRAALPTGAVARHLLISPTTPVLETTALDDAAIGPVNAVTAWFCGSRVSLVVDTPRVTSEASGESGET